MSIKDNKGQLIYILHITYIHTYSFVLIDRLLDVSIDDTVDAERGVG